MYETYMQRKYKIHNLPIHVILFTRTHLHIASTVMAKTTSYLQMKKEYSAVARTRKLLSCE